MRVAALVTEGLKTATDAIPHLSTTGKTTGKQELLRFMTSLLENFFPRGHGLVDVPRESLTAVENRDSRGSRNCRGRSRWPPFEYRVRLDLSDQIADPNLRGRHMTGNFSGVGFFTRALHGTTPSRAVLTALHEMTHMMFAMVRSLEEPARRGHSGAASFAKALALARSERIRGTSRAPRTSSARPAARPAHPDSGCGTGRIAGRRGVRLRLRCDR